MVKLHNQVADRDALYEFERRAAERREAKKQVAPVSKDTPKPVTPVAGKPGKGKRG